MPGMRDVPPLSTTVEVSFVEDGDATIVRIRHSGLPTEGASGFTTFGWTRYMERLVRLLQGEDIGPAPAPAELETFPSVD